MYQRINVRRSNVENKIKEYFINQILNADLVFFSDYLSENVQRQASVWFNEVEAELMSQFENYVKKRDEKTILKTIWEKSFTESIDK